MSVSWGGLAEAVESEDVIYLADGEIRLRVRAVIDCEVDTVVEIGGTVASRQGLNMPGSTRGLDAVPADDLDMLRSGSRSASTWWRCPSCARPRTSRRCAATRGCP